MGSVLRYCETILRDEEAKLHQPFTGRFCEKDGRKPGAADKDTALPTPATHDRKVRLKTGEKKVRRHYLQTSI